MDLTKLAEYKERLIIAKEMGNEEDLKKFLELFEEEYERVIKFREG